MTDLRLTFSADGLAAVSKVLVDMGIGFRVEPVSSAREVVAAVVAQTAPVAKRPSKATRKGSGKSKRAAQPARPPADAPAGGAERLRTAIARGGSTYRSPLAPPATTEPLVEAGDASSGRAEEPRNG
jgi:hypothetical protein